MSLGKELFEQNEWRILWWETLARASSGIEFPGSPEDVCLLAYAAEAAVRHWNQAVRQRLYALADVAINMPLLSEPELQIERNVLSAFVVTCTDPIYALEFERGPWVADDPSVSTSVLDALVAHPHVPLRELALTATSEATTRRSVRWVERYSSATLTEVLGFVNYDLGRAALALVDVDKVGAISIHAIEGNDKEVSQILLRHGFALDSPYSPNPWHLGRDR